MSGAAEILLVRDGRVLVLHRAPEPWGGLFGALWHVPGGGEEPDETPAQAAVREAHEECGLTPTDAQQLGTWSHAYRGATAMHTAFRAQCPAGEIVLNGEHDDWRWLTPNELIDYLDSAEVVARAGASSDFASWRQGWRAIVVELRDALSLGR